MTLKPWLVDVPVLVTIWIRPECQRRQFEVIKKARPSILFIQSDGGRNEEEWRIIKEHRRMYEEEIDWDCTVYRIYENKNRGMYAMMKRTLDEIWQRVDRIIYTEDDVLPSVSFFRFCAELLEKYKDDERISCICGTNAFDTRKDCKSDYFFADCASIWGFAIWKRTADHFWDFEYYQDPYTMRLLKNRSRHDPSIWKQMNQYGNGGTHAGHTAGIEFSIGFAKFGYHQLQIVPTKNLVSNIGVGAASEHAGELKAMTPGQRKMFNNKTYELEFPLKHPKYVINDVEYSEMVDRLYCRNHPIRFRIRMIARFCLMVRYGELKKAVAKAMRTMGIAREK